MKKTFLTILLVSILFPFYAQAGCEGPLVPCGRCCELMSINGMCLVPCDGVEPVESADRCTLCHLFVLLDNILRFILTCLVPLVAVLMLTIGGLLFVLSQFDIVSLGIFVQAKGIITAVVVGLVIVFASYIFLNTFLLTIGMAEWTGLKTWWIIKCQ